ncbi:MAG TPA: 6,7-dimethyl-8-ribityllumazine synthase [Stellaceae bacterium]|nr:6,7-dimethyl-8-ribityllumazine synthase [Stellaceae bacterium]
MKPHILIVEARYYAPIADALLQGAVKALEEAGASHERVAVPGAFEIPTAISLAVKAEARGERLGPSNRPLQFDGYLALGCVIRGETSHYDYVCAEAARGLQELAMRYHLALGFGILTVENEAQALARARIDRKNKGGEAARACLAMIDLKRHFGLVET